MLWVLIGVAAVVGYKIVQGKKSAPAPQAPAPDGLSLNEGYENAIQMKAKIKELELLSEIQAKLNLQTKFDRLKRANEDANPAKPVPNA